MTNYHHTLIAENYYHIYNRGNNKENIFVNDDNYLFFLDKWKLHLHPHTDTLAYCLMPNHFHFLIKVKSIESFTVPESLTKSQTLSNTEQDESLTKPQRLGKATHYSINNFFKAIHELRTCLQQTTKSIRQFVSEKI